MITFISTKKYWLRMYYSWQEKRTLVIICCQIIINLYHIWKRDMSLYKTAVSTREPTSEEYPDISYLWNEDTSKTCFTQNDTVEYPRCVFVYAISQVHKLYHVARYSDINWPLNYITFLKQLYFDSRTGKTAAPYFRNISQ